MSSEQMVVLCPGQGAQAVGMGRAWVESSPAAAETFREADEVLADVLDRPLSELCFEGSADALNRTDVSQPAIYACSVACFRGLVEVEGARPDLAATAGLSLGEYTALHLAGVVTFADGLRLVARRGRLMQDAAEASDGGMVAIIGAEEDAANELCAQAAGDQVLVTANFNAPGQIVLSGHAEACERVAEQAEAAGYRARMLTVAGAFHSPLMQPAADQMAEALAETTMEPPRVPVWSNVTAEPHSPDDLELLRQRLVEQIVRPVRWAQCCQGLPKGSTIEWVELGPGSVLRGLLRRIDRSVKVKNHDQPPVSA